MQRKHELAQSMADPAQEYLSHGHCLLFSDFAHADSISNGAVVRYPPKLAGFGFLCHVSHTYGLGVVLSRAVGHPELQDQGLLGNRLQV
jgi:hypothetical protein